MLSRRKTITILTILSLHIVCSVRVTGSDNKTHIQESEGLFPALLVDVRLQSILQDLRTSSGGIQGLKIQDPMSLPDFDSNINQGMTKLTYKLWNSTIAGLSSFFIEKIQANLVTLELDLQFYLKQLFVQGNYSLKGSILVLSVNGNGPFWMKLINNTVRGWANITITDDAQLQISSINLDFEVQKIQLHFDNLLGRGFVSSLSNSLLNAMSKHIFEKIKPHVLQELQSIVQQTVNAQFAALPPEPKLLSALSPLDLVIVQSAEEMKRLHFDPYFLPSHNREFKKKVMFFNVQGQIALYHGYVKGLSTLHRSGDIKIKFSNNTLQLSAHLGFDELEGGYKLLANFMGLQRSGGIHFKIDAVDLLLVIEQENRKSAAPIIKILTIKEIYQLRTDADGFGSLDLLMEFFVNIITNVFKVQLGKIVVGPMTKVIQKNLNDLRLPF